MFRLNDSVFLFKGLIAIWAITSISLCSKHNKKDEKKKKSLKYGRLILFSCFYTTKDTVDFGCACFFKLFGLQPDYDSRCLEDTGGMD